MARYSKGDVMPGQETSGGTRLRICPPPPEGFDPFAASRVDLARHGLPLRPDPQAQPDLAALWDRLADRYRDFEHLEPPPDNPTAGQKGTEKAAAPRPRPPPCSPPGQCPTCGTVPTRTGLTTSGPSSASASSTSTRKCPSIPRST